MLSHVAAFAAGMMFAWYFVPDPPVWVDRMVTRVQRMVARIGK